MLISQEIWSSRKKKFGSIDCHDAEDDASLTWVIYQAGGSKLGLLGFSPLITSKLKLLSLIYILVFG